MNRGGIILCGGRSSRMGTPKLALPFGPELMLQRIVRLLGEVCRPIVVVARRGPDAAGIARRSHRGSAIVAKAADRWKAFWPG